MKLLGTNNSSQDLTVKYNNIKNTNESVDSHEKSGVITIDNTNASILSQN